jgi:hypothetical protein
MSQMRNLLGFTRGRLTVKSYAGNNNKGRAKWLCQCNCGKTKVILGDHLTRRRDSVLSCGCLQQENRTKHGAYLPNADIKYHIRFSLWQSLKDRARRRGYESDLEVGDMPEIPDVCPVFKTPLLLYRRQGVSGLGKGKGNNRHDNSPTIDRFNSNLPYMKKYATNLCVISWRANRLKSDATLEDLTLLVEYVRHRVAPRERESSLIDSKPSTISAGNEAEPERDRERLSEKTPKGDAIVWSNKIVNC